MQSLEESAITSQNDTAPKLIWLYLFHFECAITSQNDTAPKLTRFVQHLFQVRLPVRTTLLQNYVSL